MALINQKEYLKKYLAPKKSHKKKKKKKTDSSRIKIIDDDLDMEATFNEAVNEDLLLMEDAPQIVGVTDDRPLNMRLSDYNNDRWKRVNTDDQTKSPELEREINSKKQDDHSPVRRNKHDSPPQRNRRDISDISPPRARNKVSNDNDNSPPRQRSKTEIIEIDSSPPRRKSKSDDNSPPRRRRKYSDGDNSPPRQRQKSNHDRSSYNSKRNSPDRNRNKETGRSRQYSQDNSPPRRSSSTKRDSSPERPRKEPSFVPVQIKREREDSVASQRSFKPPVVNNEPMAAPQTIVRDRKTGRIRDLRQEALDSKEKQKEKSVITEKYTRWGKGVKQVEDANEKMSDALHEMQKPLARYVDDDDLESFLKSREREGDPMLQYLKKKNNKNKGPEKPKYEGDCGPPNRYAIRPGFRWDGVNRSNGFETKYFEVQNAKRASQEDAYKWNSEDL